MDGTRRTLFGFSLAGSILLSGAGYASPLPDACTSAPSALGKYRPALESKDLPRATYFDEAGNEHSLSDFRGAGLVVNFWATWCVPCVKEMPALDRLAEAAGARGLRVIALSADREGASVVREFYEKNHIRHLPLTIDKLSRAARAIGIDGLPTTVLYDSDGREAGRVIGVAEWDTPAALGFLSSCLASG